MSKLQALKYPSLLLAVFIAGQVQADALQTFSSRLAAIESYQAHFVQRVNDQHGRQVQQVGGTLYAVRPGKLRWVADEPYAQLIVVDGEQIWRYEADLEQVVVSDYAGDLGDTPALLLSGDTRLIAERYHVSYVGQDYRLLPRNESNLFREMRVSFRDNLLVRLQLEDALGQTTVLALDDIAMNPQLAPGLFRFVPPAGVDVLHDS